MSLQPVRILLNQLIDYAGLFPPSALSMKTTVRNYAAYRGGRQSFALGRLVVPAIRLCELEEAAAPFLPESYEPENPWRLTVLCGADLSSDLGLIDECVARQPGRVVIDSLELRAQDEAGIAELDSGRLRDRCAYVEIPAGEGVERRIGALRRAGLRAKLRTGGLTPEAIPASSDVLSFLAACYQLGVPFKATAGLHHPVRGRHFLTADPDGPLGRMHGFLNLFLAAAYLRQGLPESELLALLDESDQGAFECDDKAFHWRGRRLDTHILMHVRANFALSFGSCSFVTPMDDLVAMGFL